MSFATGTNKKNKILKLTSSVKITNNVVKTQAELFKDGATL